MQLKGPRLYTTLSGNLKVSLEESNVTQIIKADSYENQTVPLKIQSDGKKIEELLLAIIQQLEITNLHLANITDLDFDINTDIENTDIYKV